MPTRTIVYTVNGCPACARLKSDWASQGIDFEEHTVDDNQAALDEAVKHGDMVPVILFADGRVEVGYKGMIG